MLFRRCDVDKSVKPATKCCIGISILKRLVAINHKVLVIGASLGCEIICRRHCLICFALRSLQTSLPSVMMVSFLCASSSAVLMAMPKRRSSDVMWRCCCSRWNNCRQKRCLANTICSSSFSTNDALVVVVGEAVVLSTLPQITTSVI